MAPLHKREGFRHLWLGDSGQGKTYANRILITWLEKVKAVDVILTIDDKNRWQAQFLGAYRANPNDLRKRGLESGESGRHVVFRGHALRGDVKDAVEIDSVGTLAWDLVRLKPCKVLINVDELSDATNGHQNWDGQAMPDVYRKGRGVGISVVAGTQLPQALPREAFGLSETIGIFRLDARELTYLYKYAVIGEDLLSVIPSLEVGQWVLYAKGRGGWDGKIYKF